MNKKRWQQLKQKLANESDLSKIWLFYMDHFADIPEFMDLGQPAGNKFLNGIIFSTCQQIFDKKIKITDFLSIYIPEYQFFHGPFQIDRRIGGVIYFEDIKKGLIAVSADFPPTGMVKYSRFTEVMNLSTPSGNELN
jgi:hypothetical protein